MIERKLLRKSIERYSKLGLIIRPHNIFSIKILMKKWNLYLKKAAIQRKNSIKLILYIFFNIFKTFLKIIFIKKKYWTEKKNFFTTNFEKKIFFLLFFYLICNFYINFFNSFPQLVHFYLSCDKHNY